MAESKPTSRDLEKINYLKKFLENNSNFLRKRIAEKAEMFRVKHSIALLFVRWVQ